MSARRERFIIQGQVQGVGFRPFVFALAEEYGLSGLICNSPRGVLIEVQGSTRSLDDFAAALEGRLPRPLPPLARLTSVQRESCAIISGERGFCIADSMAGPGHAVLISPDTATCSDCLTEARDPADRRFRYPFINCTNCGPRYTITRSIPYDRAGTSMACFPMCPDCLAEYENPRDRRFHAQPNACPVCGPSVWFMRKSDDKSSHYQGDEALAALAQFLYGGGIAAIKGLGGFLLACDACDHQAVMRLRQRKNRPHKPFALMAADLEEIRRFALVGPAEEALLLSPERPIVLCPLLNSAPLSPSISPDTRMVGVMLPYTPLHTVLFDHLRALGRTDGSASVCCQTRKAQLGTMGLGFSGPAPERKASLAKYYGKMGHYRLAVLVMTSGNPGGEPICLSNRKAADRLGHMAEAFLFHDRDILTRADDSVLRLLPDGNPLFLRRARGYVPRPLPLPEYEPAPEDQDALCILGTGAELKNTLCLTKGADAFVSQHIGDMANLETAAFHAEMREHLAGLLQATPQAVIRDLHPDYLASQMADALGSELGIPVYRLQHHFAHAHAVLAENRFRGKALVLALDGTGLGTDGKLWGGELLLLHTGPPGPEDEPRHVHVAAFAPLDLPGGETALREPWRIAHALLLRLGLYDPSVPLPWLPEYEEAARLLPVMLEKGINTPVSTSCGRLFDAMSALLGLCNATTYEGQAAIRLEEAGSAAVCRDTSSDTKLRRYPDRLYPCPCTPDTLDTHALFAAVYDDIRQGEPVSAIARRFHRSLAVGLAELAAFAAHEHGVTHVGLSGGCMQNVTLVTELCRELEQRGITPLLHKELPPGDGCISFGQAAWATLHLALRLPGS